MATAAPFAVTGASGSLGSRVARRLAEAGAAPRILARDPARLPDVPGAVAGPPAPYGDGEAMRRALDGVGTLFLVSAHEHPDRVRDHATAVDAAAAAGVGRIVYVSFLGAAPDATFTFARDHWHTEQHIRGSGLRFTFLRDSLYLGILPAMTGADGVIRGPAGEGRVAAVAHEDVADVAAAVLLGDGHDGAAYDVTGPETLSLDDAARELTRFAGRPVSYRAETREEAYASRSAFGAPRWEVDGWVSSYEAIATGELGTLSDTVQRLADRPAQTLTEFLAKHPDSYRHLLPGH